MKRKMKEYIVTIISRKQKQEIQLKATNKKEAKEMVIDVIKNTYLLKNQKLNPTKNVNDLLTELNSANIKDSITLYDLLKTKCRKNRRLM